MRSLLAARLAWSLLAVATMLAGACTSAPDDPEGDLAAAFERTLADSFSYRLSVEADRDALESLGEGAASATAFLSTFAVVGTTGADGGQLRVQVLGTDLLDVRRLDAEHTYVRLGLTELPGLPEELADPAALLPALVALGLGEQVEVAGATLLEGGWVLLEGALDAAALRESSGAGAASASETASVDEALGADTEERIRRFVEVTEQTEAGARRTFRVSLHLRELVQAVATLGPAPPGAGTRPGDAAAVPEVLAGTVFVEDGVVTRIRLDLSALTDDDTAVGQVELQLDLDDHGQARPPTAPEARTTLSAQALVDALATLLRFVAGVDLG